MKKLFFLLLVMFCVSASGQKKVVDSKTSFAKEALQPYLDSGELPGAISIFYNNGVQETCWCDDCEVGRGRQDIAR